MPVAVLPTRTYGTASAWLYLSTVRVEENCAGGLARRIVNFNGTTLLHRSDHIADNCAMRITYGLFDALDAPPSSATIEIATGNTEVVIARESAIAVLGVP